MDRQPAPGTRRTHRSPIGHGERETMTRPGGGQAWAAQQAATAAAIDEQITRDHADPGALETHQRQELELLKLGG